MSSSPKIRLKVVETEALPVFNEDKKIFLGGRKVERLLLGGEQLKEGRPLLAIACKVDSFFGVNSLREIVCQEARDRAYRLVGKGRGGKRIFVDVRSLQHRLGLKQSEIRAASTEEKLYALMTRRAQDIQMKVEENFQSHKKALNDVKRAVEGNISSLQVGVQDVADALKVSVGNTRQMNLQELSDCLQQLSEHCHTVRFLKGALGIDEKQLEDIEILQRECSVFRVDEAFRQLVHLSYLHEQQDREGNVSSYVEQGVGYLRKDGRSWTPVLLGARLGVGGFGAVYTIHDLARQKIEALKLPRKQKDVSIGQKQEVKAMGMRFIHEIRQGARVMPVYLDEGLRAKDGFDIARERKKLKNKEIQSQLPIIFREFLCLVDDLLDIKNKGYLHLDIKPENCAFQDPGVAHIIDLENLKKMGAQEVQRVAFTPFFNTAEEAKRLKKGNVDGRDDEKDEKSMVFQLGMTFLDLMGVTSTRMVERDSDGVITNIRTETLSSMLHYRLNNDHLLTFLLNMISMNPDERLTLEEVRQELDDLLS